FQEILLKSTIAFRICPFSEKLVVQTFADKMNYNQYRQLFDEILNNPKQASPYNDEIYLNYTKLNRTRMKRWDKKLVLDVINLYFALQAIVFYRDWLA